MASPADLCDGMPSMELGGDLGGGPVGAATQIFAPPPLFGFGGPWGLKGLASDKSLLVQPPPTINAYPSPPRVGRAWLSSTSARKSVMRGPLMPRAVMTLVIFSRSASSTWKPHSSLICGGENQGWSAADQVGGSGRAGREGDVRTHRMLYENAWQWSTSDVRPSLHFVHRRQKPKYNLPATHLLLHDLGQG